MSSIEFQPFDKIARMNRSVVITEKIDGTNAAVRIIEVPDFTPAAVADLGLPYADCILTGEAGDERHRYAVVAQSRTRFITPENDNYGFAKWVQANAQSLVEVLGEGTHFGEWWGAGIQRKYDLTGSDKRFSLFNTARWGHGFLESVPGIPAGLGVVPLLYDGPFDQGWINGAIDDLRNNGSFAAPGFMRPEGIVIYHTAARQSFKITLEGDEAPKGAAGHALDQEEKAA